MSFHAIFKGNPLSRSHLASHPRQGTNLSDAYLWGQDAQSEDDRRKAFNWLTKTGAGRRFGEVPVDWYRQHQVAAIEVLQKAAGVRGLAPDPHDESWYFKLKNGEYQVWDGGRIKWLGIGVSPRQVFDAADRKVRGP